MVGATTSNQPASRTMRPNDPEHLPLKPDRIRQKKVQDSSKQAVKHRKRALTEGNRKQKENQTFHRRTRSAGEKVDA